MNVYQLDTETLRQCKLEDDTDNRTTQSPFFIVSYNFAYERIMREILKPWVTEAVPLDKHKCFEIGDLTKRFVQIKHIALYPDYSENAQFGQPARFEFKDADGQGKIVVPVATPEAVMYVTYQYMPPRLIAATTAPETATATNTPQMDEAYHDILTYWAAHRYFTARGVNYVEFAQFWKNAFEDAFSRIDTGVGVPNTYKNAYRPL